MPRVLFSTNCYWKDFDYLYDGGFEYKALLNNYPFAEKWIVTHTIRKEAAFLVDKQFEREDVATDALQELGLAYQTFRDPLTGEDGWIYSIDSVIELAFAKDFDYICHFCGDVELYRKADWITAGIQKIEEGYMGARPKLPVYRDSPQQEQDILETDIFSDHVYLIPVEFYRENIQEIFSLTEPSCADIHPKYGGESFERKMTRYLKATGEKLAIIQNAIEVPVQL